MILILRYPWGHHTYPDQSPEQVIAFYQAWGNGHFTRLLGARIQPDPICQKCGGPIELGQDYCESCRVTV